jgi:general secretion pathway protein G
MKRRHADAQTGFTLIELLIVIAIIGILAALLIPNLLDAIQKSKQKRTLADMRITGVAMFAWMTDNWGAAAAGQTGTPSQIDLTKFGGEKQPQDMAAILVPQYTQTVPERDGWKNRYHYWLNTASQVSRNAVAVASGGQDGSCGCGTYASGAVDPTDYSQDLVWADGFFIRWPQKQ